MHYRVIFCIDLVLHTPEKYGRVVILRTYKLDKLIRNVLDKLCTVFVKFSVLAVAADIGNKRNLSPDDKSVTVAEIIEIIYVRIMRKTHRICAYFVKYTEIGILHLLCNGVSDAVKILMFRHAAERI